MTLKGLKGGLPTRGCFVALTGIDGAGKTTLARILCDLLNRRGPGRWFPLSRYSLVPESHCLAPLAAKVNDAIWADYDLATTVEAGNLFWFHQRMAWYALASRILPDLLATGQCVVIDDWYYKIYARFLVELERPPYIEDVVSALLQPDVVILIDLDPEVAARRKTAIKAGEAGFFDGSKEIDPASFITYQRRIRQQLLCMAAERGWVIVQGTEPPEDTATLIAELPAVALPGRCETGPPGEPKARGSRPRTH